MHSICDTSVPFTLFLPSETQMCKFYFLFPCPGFPTPGSLLTPPTNSPLKFLIPTIWGLLTLGP